MTKSVKLNSEILMSLPVLRSEMIRQVTHDQIDLVVAQRNAFGKHARDFLPPFFPREPLNFDAIQRVAGSASFENKFFALVILLLANGESRRGGRTTDCDGHNIS